MTEGKKVIFRKDAHERYATMKADGNPVTFGFHTYILADVLTKIHDGTAKLQFAGHFFYHNAFEPTHQHVIKFSFEWVVDDKKDDGERRREGIWYQLPPEENMST